MTRINYAGGALYADAVNVLLEQRGLEARNIEVIGYDGRTIYQEPPDRNAMNSLDALDCQNLQICGLKPDILVAP